MAALPLDSDLVTGPSVPGAPTEPVLRIHDIQGNVLPGLNTRCQLLLGVRFDEADAASALRSWLARIMPRVTSLATAVAQRNARRAALRRGELRPRAGPMLSLALNADGLRLLTSDVDEMHDEAFKGGMYGRSSLGDPRPPARGSSETWLMGGSRGTTPHVLLTLGGDVEQELARSGQRTVEEARRAGGSTIFEQAGQVLPGAREHFGFRDGISQPAARGRLSDLDRHYLVRRYLCPDDPAALTQASPGQPLVWPGQFVFGYPGQDSTDPLPPLEPERPFGPEWMVDGSYLVVRRLQQDVAAFRAGLTELRGQIAVQAGVDLGEDQVAALIVGRLPDGAGLTRDPEDPDKLGVNHFAFANAVPPACVLADDSSEPDARRVAGPRLVAGAPADDPASRCPGFAHIRKTNPRDLTTDQGDAADTLARLVARRGITWGSPFPNGAADHTADLADRGVLFQSYQASIVDQFEVLNTRWMNRAGAPEARSGHDLLVGQHHEPAGRRAELHIAGSVVELNPSAHWVLPTGGGYFFTPSISALRRFARTP